MDTFGYFVIGTALGALAGWLALRGRAQIREREAAVALAAAEQRAQTERERAETERRRAEEPHKIS